MRVLIVGLGSIARKHIAALRELRPDAEVIALRSTSALPEAGVQNICNLDELAAQPDFAIISNPTRYHINAIKDAVALRCPLFIEKPVLSSLEDIETANDLDLHAIPTYIACNLRFHPCVKYLKDHLSVTESKINEVNIYCGSDLSSWRPGQDYSNSYSAKAAMGGGVHLDLIHEIDYCYWLFGKPDAVRSTKRKVSGLLIDSFDFAAFQLNYPRFTANIILNYYRPTPMRRAELVLNNSVLIMDLLSATITRNDQLIYQAQDFKMADTYSSQMAYFLEHMELKQQMMNTFDEASEVLKIALA